LEKLFENPFLLQTLKSHPTILPLPRLGGLSFPFVVFWFKLHLNYTAVFIPYPAYLRDRTIMRIFGVVAGFFLADSTH
jgi:hypothetical protein